MSKFPTQPEVINLETVNCGICGQPLMGKARSEGHAGCIRADIARQATQLASQGNSRFVDEREEFVRSHPDNFLGRDGLTYNQRLEKQEAERQETERQKVIELNEKKRYLAYLESQVEHLRKQISQTEVDEANDETRTTRI